MTPREIYISEQSQAFRQGFDAYWADCPRMAWSAEWLRGWDYAAAMDAASENAKV